MPTRRIQRGPATGGPPVGFQNSPSFNELYVDGLTDALMVGTGISGANAQPVVQQMIAAFVEDPTTLTYTATFPLPAGAMLENIFALNTVLWAAGGTAALTIGDANAANGWFTSTNLKATDLLVGERLEAANPNCWGGVNGAYLVAATGRFGQQASPMMGGYCVAPYSVIATITVTGPSASAGRTFVIVSYSLPIAIVPTRA
jgi:hypothetical protein